MLTTRGPAHRRSSGLRGRAARAALALGTTLLVPAIAAGALAPTASAATTLIQKPGTAGCIAKSGFGGCTVGRGVGSVQSVALSPDGANAYAASDYGDSLAVFDRAADGTLTQKAGLAGCFATDSATEPCTPAAALDGAWKVALSPDGKSVYVAARFGDAIAVFDRAADGTLVQKPGTAGCISDAGAGPCTSGHDLDLAADVIVSADGATVYAGTQGGKLLVFDRAADGALTQRAGLAGCVAEVPSATCSDGRALEGPTHIALSPDGRSLYVSAQLSNAVALFDVAADGTPAQKPGSAGCISADGSGGACGFAKALRSASSVTLSPSGADVYVTAAGSDGVAVFSRAGDGTLTQKPGTAGCVSSMPSNGACGNAIMLDDPTAIAVSPDGANAYVTTRPLINLLSLDGAVVVFDRAADGSLTQKAAPAGCVYSDPDSRCVTARALNSPSAVTVSPDSASAYVASPMASAVSVFDTNRPAPPPPAPPAAPARDTVKPLLRGLSLRPARFKAASRGATIVARGGTKIAYRLSERATVLFVVQRVVAGRRSGGRCVALRRSNRSAKRCDRYLALRGAFAGAGATFSTLGVAGANTLRFSGRLANRRLAVGRYRLRAVASDGARNSSAAKVARFEIRRR